MLEGNQITLVGNLVADPELRFGPSGRAVCNFRVIANRTKFNRDTQQREPAGQLSVGCSAWGALAENIAESLTKGMRVVVTGVLDERRYEDKQGQARTALELNVDEIGPSLTWATAKVTKSQRNSGGFGGGQGGAGGYTGGGQGAQGGYNGGGQGGYGGGQGGYGGNQGGAGNQGGYGAPAGSNQGGYGAQANQDDPWGNMPGGYQDEPPF